MFNYVDVKDGTIVLPARDRTSIRPRAVRPQRRRVRTGGRGAGLLKILREPPPRGGKLGIAGAYHGNGRAASHCISPLDGGGDHRHSHSRGAAPALWSDHTHNDGSAGATSG